jgi:N-formylmaleamate deformylase
MDAQAMKAFCPTWTDEQLRLRAEWLHTCDERAIRASFTGFQEDDIYPDLAALRCPALLITAGRGDVVSDADRNEWKALVPDLQLSHVKDAGHMIPWDDEEGFYLALGDFLGAPLAADTGRSPWP